MTTQKDLKRLYLGKLAELPPDAGTNKEYHIRKMAKQLCNKFDEVWIKYNNNKATYIEWKIALNKWLTMETL